MKISNTFRLLFIMLIGLNLACEKYLQVPPPNNQVETNSVFVDSSSADLALTGLYANLMYQDNAVIGVMTRWGGLYADELDYTLSAEPIRQFLTNSLQIDNPQINALWAEIYKHIYQANSIIDAVTKSTGIPDHAKKKLIGEAKFIRSFLFFYAVNNWGDVPLTLSTDYRVNEMTSRMPVNVVYDQIIADLSEAFNALEATYRLPNRIRPNKWAAAAFLARVYLYVGDWLNATRMADQVINSGVYEMESLADVFKIQSRETIWQIYPATGLPSINTYDGNLFIPSSFVNNILPAYLIVPNLYDSFHHKDLRVPNWIGTKIIGDSTYYFPYKYKVRIDVDRSEYPIVFRFAELFLIRAEAHAGRQGFAAAIADINIIRNRAGLDLLEVGLTGDAVVQALENERRHEFFAEFGHRFYDLKRTNRADVVLSEVKGNLWEQWKSNWPIPLNQLLANPFLLQNEGYN